MTISGSNRADSGRNRADGEAGPHSAPLYQHPSMDTLTERALRLSTGGRALLGIVGEPGAGKATCAEQLLRRFTHRQLHLRLERSA